MNPRLQLQDSRWVIQNGASKMAGEIFEIYLFFVKLGMQRHSELLISNPELSYEIQDGASKMANTVFENLTFPDKQELVGITGYKKDRPFTFKAYFFGRMCHLRLPF